MKSDIEDKLLSFRARLSELRVKKGVSEYRMSTDLGHSKSYIQSISSGKSMPSMSEFFYICNYLNVSYKDFFDTDLNEPSLINELMEKSKKLSENDLKLLIELAERLGHNQKNC